jgi:hypothetical protein
MVSSSRPAVRISSGAGCGKAFLAKHQAMSLKKMLSLRLQFVALLLVIVVVMVGCGHRAAHAIADGTYYGYDEMPNLSPEDPDAYWYHENTLVVRGTVILLKKKPYSLINGIAIPQPADGGFYTYEGSQSVHGQKTIVELRLISCDYCGIPEYDSVPSNLVRGYVIQAVPKAAFELDRVRYQTKRDPKLHPIPDSIAR